MATWTLNQLRLARNRMERIGAVRWTKSEIRDALESAEDTLVSPQAQSAISSAIEGVAPGVFTAAEKRAILALACAKFAREEGVI